MTLVINEIDHPGIFFDAVTQTVRNTISPLRYKTSRRIIGVDEIQSKLIERDPLFRPATEPGHFGKMVMPDGEEIAVILDKYLPADSAIIITHQA